MNDIWGVTEYIKRGIAGDENYMNAYRNAAKAYQCALLCHKYGRDGRLYEEYEAVWLWRYRLQTCI